MQSMTSRCQLGHTSARGPQALPARSNPRPCPPRCPRPARRAAPAVVCVAAEREIVGASGAGQPVETVPVKFTVQLKVAFGEHLCVAGSIPELGGWEPASAPQLRWTEGHLWTATVDVPAGSAFEFKFVHIMPNRAPVWEFTPNRSFTADAATARAPLAVETQWNSPAAEFEAKATEIPTQAVEMLELLETPFFSPAAPAVREEPGAQPAEEEEAATPAEPAPAPAEPQQAQQAQAALVLEDPPAVAELPVVEEAVAVEEVPAVEEALAVAELPVVEEALAVQEAPVVEEAAAPEPAAAEPPAPEAAVAEQAVAIAAPVVAEPEAPPAPTPAAAAVAVPAAPAQPAPAAVVQPAPAAPAAPAGRPYSSGQPDVVFFSAADLAKPAPKLPTPKQFEEGADYDADVESMSSSVDMSSLEDVTAALVPEAADAQLAPAADPAAAGASNGKKPSLLQTVGKAAGFAAMGVAAGALMSALAVDVVDVAVMGAVVAAAGGAALNTGKPGADGEGKRGRPKGSEPGVIVAAGVLSALDMAKSALSSNEEAPKGSPHEEAAAEEKKDK